MHKHRSILHFLKNRELDELYACVGIKYFAVSMIGIFIPLYLLSVDYSLIQVFLFYAIISIIHGTFGIIAGKITSKYGIKHTILFSVPILILFYTLLYLIPNFPILFYIAPIFYGIHSSMFWIAFHSEFSKVSKKKDTGKAISIRKLLINVFSVLGPLIGGLIITFLGFKILFGVVSLLLLCSTIPLFKTKDIYFSYDISLKKAFQKRTLKNYIGHIGYGIESCGGLLWPLFVFFLVITNFAGLGFLTTVSLVFSFIFIFLIGYFSDIHKHHVMRYGATLNAITWIFKIFATTTIFVFVIDSFYGLTKSSMNIPFDTISYEESKKKGILNFMIFREAIIHFSRVGFFLLMMIIVGVFLNPSSIITTVYLASVIGFILIAIGSLMYIFF